MAILTLNSLWGLLLARSLHVSVKTYTSRYIKYRPTVRTGPLLESSMCSGSKKPRSSGLVVKVNSDDLEASDLLAEFGRTSASFSGSGSLGSCSVGSNWEYPTLGFYMPSRESMRLSVLSRR